LGAGLLLGLTLCSACTPNPKAGSAPAVATASPRKTDMPTPAATTTESAEASGTQTPAGGGSPLRPEGAIGLTVPAAEGFVQYFFETLNYLKAGGDGSATTEAADPGCRPCNAMLTTYRKANGANAAIVGDYVWRDVRVSSAKLTDAATAEVTMTARQGAYKIKPGPTAPTETVKPEEFSLRLTLSAQGDQWMMFDFERENTQ
jgi:hypothetical protein